MHDKSFGEPVLPWSDSFSVGIESLDADHRALVGLINDICALARSGERERTAQTLTSLCALAASHFEREEVMLKKLSGYRHLAAHAGEHRNRLKQLSALQERYEGTNEDAQVGLFCEDLVHWFVRQSIGHDAEIRSFSDDRGSRFQSRGNRGQ
jgi:hemerythrin